MYWYIKDSRAFLVRVMDILFQQKIITLCAGTWGESYAFVLIIVTGASLLKNLSDQLHFITLKVELYYKMH